MWIQGSFRPLGLFSFQLRIMGNSYVEEMLMVNNLDLFKKPSIITGRIMILPTLVVPSSS